MVDGSDDRRRPARFLANQGSTYFGLMDEAVSFITAGDERVVEEYLEPYLQGITVY